MIAGHSHRAAAAKHAIDAWTRNAGFARLRELFGAVAADPSTAHVATSVRRHAAWVLGGEPIRAAEELLEADDPIWTRLLALEELGSFCWNFRGGMPRGVLHLLAVAVGRVGLAAELPALAEPSAWESVDDRALLATYLGDAARTSAVDGALPSGALDAARSYPVVAEHDYMERWQAANLPFADAARSEVHASADRLGLVTPGRPTGDYDHVIVLGGGGSSPWLRAHYAAELIASFDLRPRAVWMLGSPRLIDEQDERDVIARLVHGSPDVDPRYLHDSADEFDLMAIAAERAFSATCHDEVAVCGCTDLDRPCPVWSRRFSADVVDTTNPHFQHMRHRSYESTGPFAVHVLSAATSRPPARPNTADTYTLFSSVASLSEGQRALIVTTQVFVPFQYFDALRMLTLPSGLHVDAVGFGFDRGDRPETPEYELQEVLSALRSARRLAVDVERLAVTAR